MKRLKEQILQRADNLAFEYITLTRPLTVKKIQMLFLSKELHLTD